MTMSVVTPPPDHYKGQFSAFKDSCDYIGSTWKIKNNLLISWSFTEPYLQSPLCRVRYDSHRFSGLGGPWGGGALFYLPQSSHMRHLGWWGHTFLLPRVDLRWCEMSCIMHITWCLLHSIGLEYVFPDEGGGHKKKKINMYTGWMKEEEWIDLESDKKRFEDSEESRVTAKWAFLRNLLCLLWA